MACDAFLKIATHTFFPPFFPSWRSNEFNNIRFTVPLKKGEEQEIHFHYELSYPSDKTVVIQSAH